MAVRLSDVLAETYMPLHRDVKAHLHTEYWLKGGRSSLKSSFVSVEIVLGMMQDQEANGAVFRKTEKDLRQSVFEQLEWAIDILGVSDFWRAWYSPMQLVYRPTGQRIIFRGADDPKHVKSVKLKRGYFKYLWFEELDEFFGMEEIRNINQSFVRGGDVFSIFYSYNPPKSKNSWVNAEAKIPKDNRLVHHSTYLDAPAAWIGQTFIYEAEHLKLVKPEAYAHEYLGEETGTGGEVFNNIKLRALSADDCKQFDNIRRGIDWGYAVDPFVYLVMHYDRMRRRLYIFKEIFKVRLSNVAAAEMINADNPFAREIVADSAEPKSIAEMQALGLRVVRSRKGHDSIDFGIKWLQDLEEIVIDPDRCPNAAREFYNYQLTPDGNGGFKAGYPDHDNHTIDAARYGCQDDMRNSAGLVQVNF